MHENVPSVLSFEFFIFFITFPFHQKITFWCQFLWEIVIMISHVVQNVGFFLLSSSRGPLKWRDLGHGGSRMLLWQLKLWCFITLPICYFGLGVFLSLSCQINATDEEKIVLICFICNVLIKLFR